MVADAGVLALDLMDTVVRDPFFHVLPGRLQLSVEELFELLDARAWIEFETGVIDEAAYLAGMFRGAPPPGLSAVGLRDIIVESYAYVDGMEALLAELSQRGPRLWVLSNYSPWFDRVRRVLALDRFFEGHVVSCATGHRKPDPRAYRALLEQARVAPADVLFVDDREVNLEAAQALGLDALRFVDAEALRRELCRRGLLS